MKAILMTGTLLASAACAGHPALSVVDVIGRPEALNGQIVQVVGYVTFEFEGTALYESAEGLRTHAVEHAIALQIYEPKGDWSEAEAAKWHELNNKYKKLYEGKKVVIEGTYRSGPGGHLGTFKAGELLLRKISEHK